MCSFFEYKLMYNFRNVVTLSVTHNTIKTLELTYTASIPEIMPPLRDTMGFINHKASKFLSIIEIGESIHYLVACT